MSEVAIERLIQKMREAAKPFAQAKAQRVYLEEFRKSKLAMLVKQTEGTVQERDAYARTHHEYLEVIDGLKQAVAQEEELRWRLKAAEYEIEAWRTRQANQRSERSAYRA